MITIDRGMIGAIFNQINGVFGEFFSTIQRFLVLLQLRAKKICFEQDTHIVNAFCGKRVDSVSAHKRGDIIVGGEKTPLSALFSHDCDIAAVVVE